MQEINYKEAAAILNRSVASIEQAVTRGSLTRIKRRGRQAYLFQEQVVLFQNRTQISTRLLSPSELAIWKQCKQVAENYDTITQPLEVVVAEQVTAQVEQKLSALGDIIGRAIQEALGPTPLSRGRL